MGSRAYRRGMTISTPRALFLIFLLWLAGLAAAAQFAKIAVPFDLFRAHYAGNSVGWMLTLISALGAMAGMSAGVVVNLFGCKPVLVSALLLGGGLSLWQATLPGFTPMLLSRLIEGAAHLAIVVAAPTLIAEISPARLRNMAMALWSTFFGVAFALMSWVGGPFVAEHGLGALFILHGSAMIALGLGLAVALPRISHEVQETSLHRESLLHQHIMAYRSPRISAAAFGWLCYTFTFVSLLALLPGLLPESDRALVAGLMPLASIAAALLLVPVLLKQMSGVALVILGFGLAILVIGGVFAGGSASVLSIVLFGVLGLVQSASFVAIPQLNTTQTDRALANGAMAQMGNIGNLMGTPVLLFILMRVDLHGVLLCVALCYLAGILLHLWMWQSRNQHTS